MGCVRCVKHWNIDHAIVLVAMGASARWGLILSPFGVSGSPHPCCELLCPASCLGDVADVKPLPLQEGLLQDAIMPLLSVPGTLTHA